MAKIRDVKKIIKWVSLSILFLFIIGFAFFNSRGLIFGVKIKNVVLDRGTDSQINTVKITGNAKNAKVLSLNGREISIDQAGNFDETIALLLGYNIITLKAEDKFGYKDEEVYQLLGK